MDIFDLLIYEHENVEKLVKGVRKVCIQFMNNNDNTKNTYFLNKFDLIMDFMKKYIEENHYEKEETILFKKMQDELHEIGKKLTIQGMNVEHDLGKLYFADLEKSIINFKEGEMDAKIDIIANAMGYTYLLVRHRDKENNAIYTFAMKNLSNAAKVEIIENVKNFKQKWELIFI